MSHAQHSGQRQTQELSCVSAVYKSTGLESQNPKQQYNVREIREKGRNQVTARLMVQNLPKIVDSATDSNNQRLFTMEVFLTLSQISSYVSRIATKRKQLSASEHPASENENISRGKNDIMRSPEESHSHPFEVEEFRQLCEMKRKKTLLSPGMQR